MSATETIIRAFDLDKGYSPIDSAATPDEMRAVEEVMIVGMTMCDSKGLRLPFHIPPSVALAIVRKIRGGP